MSRSMMLAAPGRLMLDDLSLHWSGDHTIISEAGRNHLRKRNQPWGSRRVTKTDMARVETYLRRLFGTERVRVVAPVKAGATVEVAVGEETVGTLHKDVEDGEVSFAVHLTILEEDLPVVARPAAAPLPGRRTRS